MRYYYCKWRRDNMKKVCVVTGGALGIGKCIVETFAKNGAAVVFIDFNKEALENTEKQMRAKGYEVTGYYGDIAEESVLVEFADYVLKKYEKIDYLINNACISKKGILSGCSYEDFNYVLRIGVSAPYMLAKLFKDKFNKGASIVNISSTRAFMSQPDTESYTAAKGGITALTHALAISLAGIARVNSIAPGWIDTGKYHDESYIPEYSAGDTEQHPSKRVGVPEDIANVVLMLCDERNSFINGENITVDGGMTKLMIYHADNGWKYDV